MQNILKNKWVNAVLAGVLLWLAWPPHLLFILLFVAFIPLLYIESLISKPDIFHPGLKLFGFTGLAFMIWNGLSTWWIWNASPAGGVAAIILNSLLMTVPFLLFTWTKKRLGTSRAYIALIAYWMSFEYLHHSWELAWPWLSLGNGLSALPQLAQWYEYTGIYGGTAWILGINILLFKSFHLMRTKSKDSIFLKQRKIHLLATLSIIVIPIIISLIRFNTYKEQGEAVEVLAVQPNISAWHEKFPDGDRFIPYRKQLDRLIAITDSAATADTRIIAWPETAIPGGMNEQDLKSTWQLRTIRMMMRNHPNSWLLTGIDGFVLLDEAHQTATSRKSTRPGVYWDAYNTAIMIGKNDKIPVYHKSKLVPGVERMPYPAAFRFLEKFAIGLGGISGSLGVQSKPDVFFDVSPDIGIAPVICYESVFGAWVARYVRQGAGLIFVITNDDWWGNTAGHRQHLLFSSLRAIETRRDVVRAANTGTSCFVDQKGIIRQATDFRTQTAIRGTVYVNHFQTFYTRFGDWLARIAVLTATLLFLITFVAGRLKKKKDMH